MSDAAVNGKPAESTWAGYVDLYERLNGRTPTPAQVRAASAKRDAATACGEPFAAVIALDQEAEAGRERLASAIEAVAKNLAAPASTGPVTLAPESLAVLERIEERLGQVPTVRMIEPLFVRSNDDPLAASARDLTVFVIAVLACVAVVTFATSPILRSPVLLISSFVLGVSAALGYLWLGPTVSSFMERRRRARR